MKNFLGILLLLQGCMGAAQAQDALFAAIRELPPCALVCLQAAVVESPCSATNVTCTCTNAPLQKAVTLCVSANCTVPEALSTKNITETLCGAPIRDKRAYFNNISNSFAALSGVAIVLRVISKVTTRMDFGLDDYSIFATFIAGIPSSVLVVHGLTSNGLGKDIWTLRPNDITNYLRAFYVMEILYFLQLFLLKLSILFFYLRIFPAPSFRRILWATVVFDILFGVVFIIVGIFQCNPISYYWGQWDGLHRGKCINVNGLGWSNAVISIILDFWMLGLAISQLLHLQLHWKKKLGVGLMFVVGTFITVVSILRLQSLLHFAKSFNVTWDNLPVTIWSLVEINVGIICACMPSLRVLLVRLFPKVMGSTRNKSAGYHAEGSRSGIGMGANVSIGRGKDLAPPSKDSKSIMYSQSYNVDLEDESSLVQLKELPAGYSMGRGGAPSR
ncbi:CFEM domain-containing protein [Cadophora sp. MPI-SDFR-AT-0126]|nr:CFEM domain-containing protein [Leotiomycetes sp. MPI-SDFR-AT-0126]